MQLLDGGGDRNHLLHELGADEGPQQPGTGAGEEDPILAGGEAALAFHAREKFEDFLRLARVVALVVPPAHRAILHQHRLDGGGSDVDSDQFHDDGLGSGTQGRQGMQGAHMPP